MSLIDRDDDGEARVELEARNDQPPPPCPDCECCTQVGCWASRCAGGTCPCTND